MARRNRIDTIENRIRQATEELFELKKACDAKAEELKALEDEKRQLQLQQILEAMKKSGKTFEEILNLISL